MPAAHRAGCCYLLFVIVAVIASPAVAATGDGTTSSGSRSFASARRSRLLQAIVHKEGMATVDHAIAAAAAQGLLPGSAGGALVATDFGAVGNGKVDDGPALQRAIDAAQAANKALFIPAGVFITNQTLNISCNADSCPLRGEGTLRLMGESSHVTQIQAGRPLVAVIDILYNTQKGGNNDPASGHELYELMIDCNSKAQYGIRALSITRATIARVMVYYAQSAGAH